MSLTETAISVWRDGQRIWGGECPSDPILIAEVLRKRAPAATRVVFEIGPLSVRFYQELSAEGLPAICIDARHAKVALDMAPNKTDTNDADSLAHLAEICFNREVRVKGYDSMLVRTLVAPRTRLVRITTELSNQIRGRMKTFGLIVPGGKGARFASNVSASTSRAPTRTWLLRPRRPANSTLGSRMTAPLPSAPLRSATEAAIVPAKAAAHAE